MKWSEVMNLSLGTIIVSRKKIILSGPSVSAYRGID